jgi:hypothetical protein
VVPLLLRLTERYGDVAAWNELTLRQQAANGELWVVGTAIPRDLASENSALADAKLRGYLVLAPAVLVDAIEKAYRAARTPLPAVRAARSGVRQVAAYGIVP